MISATVMITTYNRPRSFNALVEAIRAQEPKIRIVVINDASDVDGYNFDGCEYLENETNHGKEKYYITVNKLWAQALKKRTQYYYMLADDVMINDEFFAISTKLWRSIQDKRKACLTILNQGWQECWTRFKRKKVNDDINLTQWCDMGFISSAMFIAYKIPAIPSKRWQHDKLLSSGVGASISWYWYKRKYNMYGVEKSLISHQPEQYNSNMNPIARQITKPIAL